MSLSPSKVQIVHDHERRDANVAWLVAILAFIVISGLCIEFLIGGFQNLLKRLPEARDGWEPLAKSPVAPPDRPPSPALQVSPAMDLKEFRRREDAELEGYGWVDKRAGIARIPIEQAMELVVREGLPVQAAGKGEPGPSPEQLARDRLKYRQPEIQTNQ